MRENKIKEECCPEFDPVPWDGKILEWDNKIFIRGKVKTFFYIPLNFGSVMKKLVSLADASGASVQDWMGLSDHTSRWNMDIYLAVDRGIARADNIKMSGNYLCKVYEGSFRNTAEWCKNHESCVSGIGLEIEKQYMWYTTCPACAKKYGKNYVVIVGRIKKKGGK